jgi:hypothetical protein
MISTFFAPIIDIKWNEENVLKLIEKYHEKHVFWNLKWLNHRNKTNKNDAWNEITSRLYTNRTESEEYEDV